ncbi:cytochrome c [Delftia sp. PS-11]|uniref:cytochrome c n=1 Tax=Delftia sp. PS-11 TaxID=2767222 RepID=UPI002457A96D|nr:cytochrome c [Delftia sp. PS-11]KAJ8743350.1 cytochrome c [Delftia sp. PS-11]
MKRQRVIGLGAALLCAVALLAAWVAWLNLRGEYGAHAYAVQADSTDRAAQIERGAYLARVGNCAGCHTAAGSAEYAGGRALQTPFGTLYTSNLTPDDATGLGRWSAQEFWHALHNGRSRGGRLLYPAFPYDSYTRVTQADSDALFAFLRSLPPVRAAAPAHDLGFPYGTQAALALWRALYFKPEVWQPAPGRSPEWVRGAYLAQGLGHCAACHAPRNALGASAQAMTGGFVAGQGWYAPSLQDAGAAGVRAGHEAGWVRLMATGTGPSGSALGPMAEVVVRSTQHWQAQDLQALAVYLRDEAPQADASRTGESRTDASRTSESRTGRTAPAHAQRILGEKLYGQQCAVCHGRDGQGVPGAFAPLAGNATVNLAEPRNMLLAMLDGGYPAATAQHPRPHGMPPFGHALTDGQIAAVASYVRSAWGNQAPEVGTMEVYRARQARGF